MADDSTVRIDGDTGDAQKAVGDLGDKFVDLQKQADDTGKQLSDSMSEAAQKIADSFATVPDAAEESSAKTVSTYRDAWDQFTADAYNAIADVGEKVKGLGESLANSLEHPLQSLSSGLKEALTAAGPFEAGLAAIGTAAGAAGAAMYELGSRSAETIEQMRTFSVVTGESIQKTADLKFTADVLGSSLQQMQSFQFLLERQMQATGTAAAKFSAGLKDMGINEAAFRGADLNTQVVMLSTAFRDSSNASKVAADGYEILGMRGKQYLGALTKDWKGVMDSADEFGLHLTNEDTAAAEKFSEASGKLKESIANISTEMGLRLIPTLTKVLDLMLALEKPTMNAFSGLMAGNIFGDYGAQIQTAATQQAVINKAIEAGGVAVKTYAEAIKYLTDKEKEHDIELTKAGQWTAAQQAAIDKMVASLKGESISLKEQSFAIDQVIGSQNLDIDAKTRLVAAIEKLVKGHFALDDVQKNFLKTNNDLTPAAIKYKAAVDGIIASLEGESKKTNETISALSQMHIAQVTDIDEKTRIADAIEKLVKAHAKVPPAIMAWFKANEDLTTSNKAFRKAVEDIEDTGEGYKDVLNQMDGGTVAWSLHLLESGKNAQEVGKYYGLLPSQIKALELAYKAATAAQKEFDKDTATATAMGQKALDDYYKTTAKDEAKSLEEQLDANQRWFDDEVIKLNQLLISKETYDKTWSELNDDRIAKAQLATDKWSKSEQAAIDSAGKVWDEYFALLNEKSGDTLQKQIDNVNKWEENELSKLKKDDQDWEDHYNAITNLAALKIQKLQEAADPFFKAWKDGTAGITADLSKGFSEMLSGTKDFSQSFTDIWKGLQNTLQKILNDILSYFLNNFIKGMLAGMQGQQGGFASAFSGLFSSSGTGLGSGGAYGMSSTSTNPGGYGNIASMFGGPSSSTSGYGGFGQGAGVLDTSYSANANTPGGFGQGYGVLDTTKTSGSGFSATSFGSQGAQVGAMMGAGLIAGATANPQTKAGQYAHDIATGAEYGSIAGPIGMAVGAGIGAIVAAFSVSPVLKAGENEGVTYEKNITAGASKQQQQEAQAAVDSGKWANSQDAETLIRLRDAYVTLGDSADVAEQKAEKAAKAVNDMQSQGPDAMKAAEKANETLVAQADAINVAATTGDAAMQKYGLTWKDMGDTIKAAHISDELKQIQSDQDQLITDGMDLATVTDKMANAWSQYAQDAIQSGQKIPPAQQAIIDQLIKEGKLLDANGNAVKTMADLAVPNFANLTSIANTYGISLAALGPKFTQANISSAAKQIFSDFTALTQAGADVGGVLLGMKGKITDLVNQSIQFGTVIPANMKPLIQNLFDTGQLLDQAGKKITDISTVHFDDQATTEVANAATDVTQQAKDIKQQLGDITEQTMPAVGDAAQAAADQMGVAWSTQIQNIKAQLASMAPPNIPVPPAGTAPIGTPSFANAPLSKVTSAGLALLHPGDVVGVPTPPQLTQTTGQGIDERGGVMGAGGDVTINHGDIALSFPIPPGTNVNDPIALARAMQTILRGDVLGTRTAIERLADQRIQAAM